jgi:acyl carrier protein
MASVYERIRQLTMAQLGIKDDSVTAVSSLSNLGADSLDVVELIMAVETEFSTPEKRLSIPDEEMKKMATVQDIVEYVKKQGFSDYEQPKPARPSRTTRFYNRIKPEKNPDESNTQATVRPATPATNAVDSIASGDELDTSELIPQDKPHGRSRGRYYRRYNNKNSKKYNNNNPYNGDV